MCITLNFFQDSKVLKKIDTANDDSDTLIDKNFHARYGNNLLPLPPSISIPKVTKLKHCAEPSKT